MSNCISFPRPTRHAETDEILGLISGVMATTSDVTAEQQLTRAEIFADVFHELASQYQREFARVKDVVGDTVAHGLLPHRLG